MEVHLAHQTKGTRRHLGGGEKRRVNLTMSCALLEEAKTLGLNLSEVSETGVALAVKREKERRWLEDNRDALDNYARWYEERGMVLKPSWWND